MNLKFLSIILTTLAFCLLDGITYASNVSDEGCNNSIKKATRTYNASPNSSSLFYHDFCRDRNGFIWIATESGLIKFDGANHEVFRKDQNNPGSISDNRVRRVFCDKSGRIWVGTANGLNYFDPASDTFRLIKLPPSEKLDGYIIDIAQQDDGTILFIVAGNGLYLFDPERMTDEPSTHEAMRLATFGPRFEGNSLLVDDDKTIFMGTHSGKLQMLKQNGNLTIFPICDTFILGLRKYSNDEILVYSSKSIILFNTKTTVSTPIDVSDMGSAIITSLQLRDNRTAIVASNKGLWKIHPDSMKLRRCSRFFNADIDISKAKIGAIYLDSSDNLWIGCDYHGVIMAPHKPLPFNFFLLASSIPGFRGGINAAEFSKDGIWLALEDGNIVEVSHDNKIIRSVNIDGQHDIRAILNADNRILYSVSSNGTLRKTDIDNGKTEKILSLDKFTDTFHINKFEDSSDLFISIIGEGLFVFNPDTGTLTEHHSEKPGSENLYSNWISSSLAGKKGRLWLGHFSGLSCFDTKRGKFRKIDQDAFKKMSIYAISETNDGRLLLGTSNGLIIYDPDNDRILRRLTNADGLADNDVRTIQIDNLGTVWIGTMLGMTRYNPESGMITSIHGGYGLSETAFHYSMFDKRRDEMCFVGNRGLTFFKPSLVKTVKMDKPVFITGIFLNGNKLTEKETIDGEKSLTPDPSTGYREVRLSHNDNNLLIKVSTMDFRDPENVAFEWRMDGDKVWNTKTPGNSQIVIPKLSYGRHKVFIRASDNGELSPVTELSVYVTPPWYLSIFAKCLYALVAAGIAVILFKLYRKRNLERINDAKIKFFMDISHEIRSPITCIISPLKTLLREKDLDKESKDMLGRACRNAERILGLANQLLEIRKIDKGRKTLSMEPTDINGFATEIIDLYRPMAQSKNITVSAVLQDDTPEVWIDRMNFDKVIVNLITNAIKYTPDEGKIEVRTCVAHDPQIGECAEISVTDTGIGLDPKHIDKIFERFYQASRRVAGFGIGLDLARQLVLLHHGSLNARNRDDGIRGSVFTVRIPLGKSHLSPKELKMAETPESSAEGKHDICDSPDNHPLQIESGANTGSVSKNFSPRKILIVDDDKELREYIASNFAKSWKVMEAANGSEAMKALLGNDIDIIVSDVMMPVMDGLTLLRTLKSNADTSHIPVILLSSRAEVADRLSGWQLGADGYVAKPFDIGELFSMAGNLIRNRQRVKGKYSGMMKPAEEIALPEIKGNDESLIEKVTKAIEKHIDDNNLSVESLSDEIGISRAHLHRRMKQLVGMSPSDFIRSVRVKRACELLRRHDIDITQVAYSLGFTSQPHFSTSFKRVMGMTPTEFRTRILQQNSQDEPVEQLEERGL